MISLFSHQLLAHKFSVGELDLAIRVLSSNDSREVDAIRSISPHNVLAHAWVPDRLRNVLSAMDEGIGLEPIRVRGYAFPDGSMLYSVGDGNHRTIGARLRDKKRIRAKITSIENCDPSLYVLYGNAVVQRTENRQVYVRMTPTLRTCMIFMGVGEEFGMPPIRLHDYSDGRFSLLPLEGIRLGPERRILLWRQ